jgi:hypothetical protein
MKPVCQLVEVVMFASLLLVPGQIAGLKSCQSQKHS